MRDNIHSEDVASFIEYFIQSPHVGEVYNLGGGKKNSCSILEAFEICEMYSGKKQRYEYLEENRKGDHVCYYSNLSKVKRHFPEFKIRKPLNTIIKEITEAEIKRSTGN